MWSIVSNVFLVSGKQRCPVRLLSNFSCKYSVTSMTALMQHRFLENQISSPERGQFAKRPSLSLTSNWFKNFADAA